MSRRRNEVVWVVVRGERQVGTGRIAISLAVPGEVGHSAERGIAQSSVERALKSLFSRRVGAQYWFRTARGRDLGHVFGPSEPYAARAGDRPDYLPLFLDDETNHRTRGHAAR